MISPTKPWFSWRTKKYKNIEIRKLTLGYLGNLMLPEFDKKVNLGFSVKLFALESWPLLQEFTITLKHFNHSKSISEIVLIFENQKLTSSQDILYSHNTERHLEVNLQISNTKSISVYMQLNNLCIASLK